MSHLIGLLNVLLPLAYLALVFLYGMHFFRPELWVRQNLKKALLLTLALHGFEIAIRTLFLGRFPAANFSEVSSLIAFAITLTYLYIESRIKIKTTGFFVLIIAFLLKIFAASFVNISQDIPAILDNRWFILHTVTVILGYTALFISALYGVMYLMLFYDLKSAQFSVIYRRMPSLEELSDMNTRAAILGFVFLTLTIAVGIVWRMEAFPGAAHLDPKVISSYIVWTLFGLVIYGKNLGRWTGKWLAYCSVSGFVIILLSIAITNLVLSSFHKFG